MEEGFKRQGFELLNWQLTMGSLKAHVTGCSLQAVLCDWLFMVLSWNSLKNILAMDQSVMGGTYGDPSA